MDLGMALPNFKYHWCQIHFCTLGDYPICIVPFLGTIYTYGTALLLWNKMREKHEKNKIIMVLVN